MNVTHFYKKFTLFTPFQALSIVLVLINLKELIDLCLVKGYEILFTKFAH